MNSWIANRLPMLGLWVKSAEGRGIMVRTQMHILGIDLSGPRNIADTFAAVFSDAGPSLHYIDCLRGASDERIADLVSGLPGQVIIGIDAPLSYSPGGGDRPSDAELRGLVRARGGGVGIMPPTLIRMVYLTLRGIALARMLASAPAGNSHPDIRIVEVHPGAAMLLRGVSSGDLGSLKSDPNPRRRLMDWLGTMGLNGIPQAHDQPDHFVMACAAALAAWDWADGKPTWCYRAAPPVHPFDFAC